MKFTPADMQTKTNSANKNTNLYPAELALHSSITKYPNHMIKHGTYMIDLANQCTWILNSP
jgi:hypothetical protein